MYERRIKKNSRRNNNQAKSCGQMQMSFAIAGFACGFVVT